MDELSKYDANYVPLTPITFLQRASSVYANRTSIIYDSTRFTWRQTYERCCRLAASLRSLNISKNDVVSVLAPNIPALYEMHFAVPMAGAVLNAVNTRLDAKNVATILRHSEAKIFFVDYLFIPLATRALQLLLDESQGIPLVIVIDEIGAQKGTVRSGELEYEQLVKNGDSRYVPEEIRDEWDPIALNYTSGTTSAPKGVVYSHRGAYLSTLSLLLGWEMGFEPVYLWCLPMFHCNGWTFTWGLAARGGTNVCMRSPTASEIYRNISTNKVTHMCCAPTIFNIILEAEPYERRQIRTPVRVLTGGAPPPASLFEKMESLGFHITHSYGLTEATGPALMCEWQTQWNRVSILTLADADVKNLETMTSVPRDGKTMGEIVIRGSSIMKGYLKNKEATSMAFKNGWLATGDVGVVHPDGYLEIKDRSKDVIISGGENISSVEVESVLYRHPRVLEAAVVAIPHARWGETPCAFLAVRKSSEGNMDDIKEGEIIAYCRKNLPHFMVPKKVEFLSELPKTSTGKIQKFQLREMGRNLVNSNERKQIATKNGRPLAQANKFDSDRHEKILPTMSRL
ncbi:hypothetical protein K2173_002491 [Erythroxylum novogranatense]|uniref:4-coumarate--CoA ligase n=1 Tax=Erythroxylum novogranatense TaxID=1862640 RepID=A0AAV8TQQ9_9ROSI|nr:hypothetical protein K2173_002491 [Erythroxylum novogranatense]